MDLTSAEQLPNDVEIKQNDNVESDKTDENPQPQRQDFNSDNNKIELGNLGKFAFGVSIFLYEIHAPIFTIKRKIVFFSSKKTRNYVH